MTCDEILELLKSHRANLAEMIILEHCIADGNDELIPRLNELVRHETIVSAWRELLTPEEWLLIKRHIIDGLEWMRVQLEYDARWQSDGMRSERTLKRLQANALTKIQLFMQNIDAGHTSLVVN